MIEMLKSAGSRGKAVLVAGLMLAGGLIVSGAADVEAASGLGPKERVERKVGQILRILRDESLSREARWEGIGRVVDEGFDFRSMSQSVLATTWREASPEEKRRFVEYFSQYLEETYRTKIERYTNERIEYEKETITGERAVVDTVIVTSSTRIPVSYRMRLNDGEWYAYDVVIEGISLVNNYRSTFSAIVKSEGIDGLLINLQDRIDTYKRERDAGGPVAAPAGDGTSGNVPEF